MDLYTLLKDFFTINQDQFTNINVTGICVDTREVKQDNVFVLHKGANFDSHEQVDELEDKVSAFISERPINTKVPYFIVDDANDMIGPLAAKFYNEPTKKMTNIAVTGTNGKTSVTTILSHILRDKGKNVGLVGTNGVLMNDRALLSNNKTPTTPPPLDTQVIANEFVKNKADYNIMEVTSHGLYFDRTKAIDYKYRVFTNLTADHLDFHGTMDQYFTAKSKLFKESKSDEYCIINNDSDYSSTLISLGEGTVITYGQDMNSDFLISDIDTTERGTEFSVTYLDENVKVQSPLVGDFNVYNLVSAIAIAKLEGLDLTDVAHSLTSFNGIEGRMETVKLNDITGVVDFAHSPDALENVLNTLNKVKSNKLITVFGCGGDRDKTKRPVMGTIVYNNSDISIVTSDNPRTENPEAIIKDIVNGMGENVISVVDREKAIEHAIKIANKGDVILVAGKGHETTQIIGDTEYEFNDLEVLKRKHLQYS